MKKSKKEPLLSPRRILPIIMYLIFSKEKGVVCGKISSLLSLLFFLNCVVFLAKLSLIEMPFLSGRVSFLKTLSFVKRIVYCSYATLSFSATLSFAVLFCPPPVLPLSCHLLYTTPLTHFPGKIKGRKSSSSSSHCELKLKLGFFSPKKVVTL